MENTSPHRMFGTNQMDMACFSGEFHAWISTNKASSITKLKLQGKMVDHNVHHSIITCFIQKKIKTTLFPKFVIY